MRAFTAIAFAALLLLSSVAQAADTYLVGFRTLGQWSQTANLRLDVNVWYPSVRPPRDLNYAPWEISASRAGKAVEGRFPLLLLSHDTAGTRFSYHDTAAWLASLGFVVAAPNHTADNMDNMEGTSMGLTAEPRKMETSATANTRAMVGYFILRRLSPQARETAALGILCSTMVHSATRMKNVPGRYR